MAECLSCGKKLGFFRSNDGLCSNCSDQKRVQKIEEEREAKLASERAAEKTRVEEEKVRLENLNRIFLTTEDVSNLKIKNRVSIIMSSADCSFDIKVPKAEKELLHDLRVRALELGADAVVAISFHFVENYAVTIGVSDIKKFKMIATGTAVTIE